MRKIILTKGLPGSGKTTWAKEYQRQNPDTVLVSKDDLRAMLHSGIYSHGRERFVLDTRDGIVIKALERGHEVIVHDTNLNPVHETQMKRIAEMLPWKGQCEVVIKDFTDIPIEVCIERDLKRPNSVGEKVIRTMYNQYLRPKPEPISPKPYNSDLPDCIVCDLDGTLALFGDANPYDRDFSQDKPNEAVIKLLFQMDFVNFNNAHQTEIIFLSGRQEKFRDQTRQWLDDVGLSHYKQLYMRKTDDARKDFIIKKEIYEGHIKGKYNVVAVFDDRLQVCRLWHELGLPLFRVGDPDADF
jgi:predicted kinase